MNSGALLTVRDSDEQLLQALDPYFPIHSAMTSKVLDPATNEHKKRFVQLLKEALAENKFSQRDLCVELGITIGTLTKYLRGDVDPNKVGVAIMRKLAKQLGFTTDTVLDYFETGEYRSKLTIDDVASWIQSEAVLSDLPQLFVALQRNSESAIRALPSATNKWEGYSDEEARIWCENIHETIKYFSTQRGQSIRGAWSLVEKILVDECELKNNEIDNIFEIVVSGRITPGRELTAIRSNYHSRYTDHYPLFFVLKKFNELDNYEPLKTCIKVFCDVKTGETMA